MAARGPQVVTNANWPALGRAAGPVRNRSIITAALRAAAQGCAVVVLVFAGGPGTADCRRQALAAGLEVADIRDA